MLIPKPDGTHWFCTDFRQNNKVTKSDSYPIPGVDDCVDRVENANFVSKFDLLKGYWQVPLTTRVKEISAFATRDGLYQYKVMLFGMKKHATTFQRLINTVIYGLEGCIAYIDDVVVYRDNWERHLQHVHSLLLRLMKAKLTVNLRKSKFRCAHIVFLDHMVGQGQV